MGVACERHRGGAGMTIFYIVVEGTNIRQCNDERNSDPMKFDTCGIAQEYIDVRYYRSPLHHVPISAAEYEEKYGHAEVKQ